MRRAATTPVTAARPMKRPGRRAASCRTSYRTSSGERDSSHWAALCARPARFWTSSAAGPESTRSPFPSRSRSCPKVRMVCVRRSCCLPACEDSSVVAWPYSCLAWVTVSATTRCASSFVVRGDLRPGVLRRRGDARGLVLHVAGGLLDGVLGLAGGLLGLVGGLRRLRVGPALLQRRDRGHCDRLVVDRRRRVDRLVGWVVAHGVSSIGKRVGAGGGCRGVRDAPAP